MLPVFQIIHRLSLKIFASLLLKIDEWVCLGHFLQKAEVPLRLLWTIFLYVSLVTVSRCLMLEWKTALFNSYLYVYLIQSRWKYFWQCVVRRAQYTCPAALQHNSSILPITLFFQTAWRHPVSVCACLYTIKHGVVFELLQKHDLWTPHANPIVSGGIFLFQVSRVSQFLPSAQLFSLPESY